MSHESWILRFLSSNLKPLHKAIAACLCLTLPYWNRKSSRICYRTMEPAHSFLSNAILRGFKMYIIPCKCKKEKNRTRLYGKIYILSFAKQRKKLQIVLRDQWVSWYPAMFHVSQWNMHKLNYSLALATIDHMSLGLLLVLILAPEKN